MKKKFKKNAVWNGTCYHHFGIHPSLASMYGDKPEAIETLTLEISEDQSDPPSKPSELKEEADYWGWYDEERKDLSLVYPQKFLLNMCFIYGMKVEEEAGKGKAYRLEIVDNDE